MKTITHHIPGLVLTDHEFSVPLDHDSPSEEQLTIFAREVIAPGKEDQQLPTLLFLQGGPGYASPRPTGRSGWLKRAMQDYRVLLLDQRGTGRSTPVLTQTLTALASPTEQADYLKHFRADSIVRDAEWIRQELLGEDSRWTILGQSYGGFCAVHYLSSFPESLAAVLITGGLPPLERPVDDVYRATYRRLLSKNHAYYQRYPEDRRRALEIAAHLAEATVHLPEGDVLTPHRFQQLGLGFGSSDGFENTHYLLEAAFVPGKQGKELSYPFLKGFSQSFAFDTSPIYAVLHESIYCQGSASCWSAQRLREEFPEFEIQPNQPVLFTGEMIYPWMFEEVGALKPLKAAAELLADYQDWPPLYNTQILKHNPVPCAAAIYYDDMYVEKQYSEETASSIKGMRSWITNEHEHSALRMHGEKVLDRLLGMVTGEY